MTSDEIIKEIDDAAKEEAGTIFVNIFTGQVSAQGRLNTSAVDNCMSSLNLLNKFQAEVTKRIQETIPDNIPPSEGG